jgi:hypothetical protein
MEELVVQVLMKTNRASDRKQKSRGCVSTREETQVQLRVAAATHLELHMPVITLEPARKDARAMPRTLRRDGRGESMRVESSVF